MRAPIRPDDGPETGNPTGSRSDRSSAALRALVLVAAAALFAPASHATHVPPVPSNIITFQGESYRAWWNFPDFPNVETFRLLCQEPCPLGDAYASAKFAGFEEAHRRLIQVTGIDILPSSWPLDLHLTGDAACGPWDPDDGMSAFSARHANGSLACLWLHEKAQTGLIPPLEHDTASEVRNQLVEIHEYAHVIFYGRHRFSYENVVAPLSFLIARDPPVTDPCDPMLAGYGRGKLIFELCQQNGFAWSDLAPALTELDALYHAGDGYHVDFGGATANFQLREILDDRLGGSTRDAFLASLQWAPLVGDRVPLTHAGGDFWLVGGGALLQLPPDAISAPLEVRFVEAPPNSAPDLAEEAASSTTVELGPSFAPWQGRHLDFFAPGRLTYKYGGYHLPDGIQEARMTLRALDFAGDWHEVGDSFVDLEDATVSGAVGGLGTYALAGPRGASDKRPARIVPLVVGGPGRGEPRGTTLRMHNPTRLPVSGRLVFRAEGQSGSSTDPALAFALGGRETLTLDDLVGQLGASGAGSLDVFVREGAPPEIQTRVYSDDDGATHGGAVLERKPGMALEAGESGVLLLPPELQEHAFHVGVRIPSSRTEMRVTVYAADGTRLGEVQRTFDLGRFERQSVRDLVGASSSPGTGFVPPGLLRLLGRLPPHLLERLPLVGERFLPPGLRSGIDLEGGESLAIEVLSGAALIHGETTNPQGDIDLQYVRPLGRTNLTRAPVVHIPSANATERADFPVEVRSWETLLRLHNPADSTIRGELVLHTVVDAATGATEVRTADYAIAPHATHIIPDVPSHFAVCGIGQPCPVLRRPGSLDVVPEEGPAPIARSRVKRTLFTPGDGAGFTQGAVSPFAPMQAGDLAVLLASDDGAQRSLALRTFEEGATLTVRLVRDTGFSSGLPVRVDFEPNGVHEIRLDELLGSEYRPGQTLRVAVEAGRALLWGVVRDPATGDPTYHLLRRLLYPL